MHVYPASYYIDLTNDGVKDLVLTTNSRLTDISHLNTGIYILRSEERSQKIILN